MCVSFTFLLGSGLFQMAPVAASAASTNTAKAGIVVPLYSYPTDSAWSSLIKIKESYPSVPIIAIINPDNGAGSSKDSNFVSGIKDLQSSGIVVLGYVYTNYGSRSLSTIETQMKDYKNWYGVSGIMFDEMSNSGSVSYYTSLATFAKSLDFKLTMGNPGTTVSSSLVGIFSNLCIYENPGMPANSQIDGYTSYGKAGFSYIAYGVGNMPSSSTIKGTTNYVAYLFITNLGGSNPYGGLPSYLASEVSMLSS
jgi:hypothetical protein